MAGSSSNPHPSLTATFATRAGLSSTPPLTAYLLHLMSIKKTNLCVSADVTTTSELLAVAEEVGDQICLLKTHADIISDFSDRTVRQLKEIARRRNFLIFEDRKFGDIGSTVQKQYTGGSFAIAKWAETVTVHAFPGPAIVTALKQAAADSISAYNTTVLTEISGGDLEEDDEDSDDNIDGRIYTVTTPNRRSVSSDLDSTASEGDRLEAPSRHREFRKHSIVSISTTISTRSEPLSPQPSSTFLPGTINSGGYDSSLQGSLARLGPVPYLRSVLLLAQMSSEDNLLTPEYTQKCIDIARQHPDFVMGFISQKSLNTSATDNFLTLTPGVKLPKAGSNNSGDGLGQQYRTPREVVLKDGADIIIVGRGIIEAADRTEEACRYRREAWEAYESRTRS